MLFPCFATCDEGPHVSRKSVTLSCIQFTLFSPLTPHLTKRRRIYGVLASEIILEESFKGLGIRRLSGFHTLHRFLRFDAKFL
jgi:hypothetical protein